MQARWWSLLSRHWLLAAWRHYRKGEKLLTSGRTSLLTARWQKALEHHKSLPTCILWSEANDWVQAWSSHEILSARISLEVGHWVWSFIAYYETGLENYLPTYSQPALWCWSVMKCKIFDLTIQQPGNKRHHRWPSSDLLKNFWEISPISWPLQKKSQVTSRFDLWSHVRGQVRSCKPLPLNTRN